MKKAVVILTSVLMLACLAACGSDNGAQNVSDVQQDSPPLAAGSFDSTRAISVFTREDGSGTRDAFTSLTGVGDDMYEEAVILGSTNEIRQSVSTNEYAIGYVSVGSLNDEVKALSVNGVYPSNETILDGSYVIQRPLLVCLTQESAANELVSDFIAFMTSPQGQEQIGSSWTPIANPGEDYTGGSMGGVLRVGGSTSVEPLMLKMVEAYRAINPDVTIDVSAEGSGAGINGAIAGELDIGMSSRELKEAELAELTPVVIALDGVAVVVNPSNPVDAVSIEQIHAVFTGAVTKWDALGN